MGVMEDHIEALNNNTLAVKALMGVMGKPGVASVPAADGTKRGPGRPPKVTLAQVKAAAERVRDTESVGGKPKAVALIKQHGADSLAELDESKYAAFIAACEVVLAGDGEGEEGEADL
jgi:hypothetical protein